MSFQQAMNGTATVHYGTPIAATLVNFIAGTCVLWVAWSIKVAVAGPANPLPGEWWYYLGGPMGCVFIGLGALLVRSLGVLVTGLGMIAGQLLGSLGLDLLARRRAPWWRLPRSWDPADPRVHRRGHPALAPRRLSRGGEGRLSEVR
jgi:uncharacterized membrane protein YdcZ (DUF606 family)